VTLDKATRKNLSVPGFPTDSSKMGPTAIFFAIVFHDVMHGDQSSHGTHGNVVVSLVKSFHFTFDQVSCSPQSFWVLFPVDIEAWKFSQFFIMSSTLCVTVSRGNKTFLDGLLHVCAV
jgi:hypothetical protein